MRYLFGGLLAAWGLGALGAAVVAEEQPEAAGLFAKLDGNADGQISRDEVPEEKQRLFDRLLREADKDGNSQINADELAAGLAAAGADDRLAQGPPAGGPEGGRPAGPPRGEGGGPPGLPAPEEIFQRIDTNGDGSISKEEFVEHHKQMRERFGNFRPGGPQGDRPRGEGRFGRPEGRPDGPPRDGDRRGPPRGGPREGGPEGRGPRDRGPEGRGPEGGRPDGPPRGEGRGPEGRGERGGGFGPSGPGGNPEEFFSKLDKNSDGKLTADEAPEEGRERFNRMLERQDKDGDKAITKEEFMEGARRRMERFREGRGGPEGRRPPGGPGGRPDGPPGPPPGGPEGGPPEGGPPGEPPARPEPDDEVNTDGRPEFGRPLVRAWLVQARGPEGRGPEGRRPEWAPHRRGPGGPEGRGPEARGERGPIGRRPDGPPPFGPIAIFRLLNSDGDDKISGDELAAAAIKLGSLDKDKDGAVSIREMVTLGGRVPGGEMRHPGPPGPPPGGGPPGPPRAGRGPRSMGELAGREHWDRLAHRSAGREHAHRGDHRKGKAHGVCPHCKRPMPGDGKRDGMKSAHNKKGRDKNRDGKKCDGKKCDGKKCDGKKHADGKKSAHDKKRHDQKSAYGKKHGARKGDGKCPHCEKERKGKSGDADRARKHHGHKHAGKPPGRGPAGPPHRGWGERGPGGGPMPQFDPAQMIERMTAALDGNKDGKVSYDEFTASHKKRFDELDGNKDGSLDEAERKQAAEKMRERFKNAGERMRAGRGRGGPKPDGVPGRKRSERPASPKTDSSEPAPQI